MASSDPNNRPAGGGTWTGGNQNTAAPTALALNAWTHLAATFDGATVRLYVNGVQVASQAQTAPLATTTGTLQIGGDSYPNEFFAGRIDEVRIYNGAHHQAEIQMPMAPPVGAPPPRPDTTAPSVVLPSPTAGSTVSSMITVSADASDNVGVAGVQFLLDGAPLGAVASAPPYSIVWDTASATPGSHVLQASATDFSGNATTSDPVSVTVAQSSTATVGHWSAAFTWPIVAVHANLLSTGEILAWDGQSNGNDARLWNPTTGVFNSVPSNLTNIFCAGHCQLADGKLLVAGGRPQRGRRRQLGHVLPREGNEVGTLRRSGSGGDPFRGDDLCPRHDPSLTRMAGNSLHDVRARVPPADSPARRHRSRDRRRSDNGFGGRG